MIKIIYKCIIPIALLNAILYSSCNTNRDVVSQLNQEQVDRAIHLEGRPLTTQEIQRIYLAVEPIPEGIKSKFSKLFYDWKEDWRTNPKTIFSSNTNDAKALDTYSPLKSMGKNILPLLIKELTEEENFFALVLYDDLQDDTTQKIDYTAPEYRKHILEGEQGRAVRTIKLWLNKQ